MKRRIKADWLYDEKWIKNLHKTYFWGNYGEKIVIFADGKVEVIPNNTWFIREPEDLLAVLNPPGWNNIDTSLYEEGVGIHDEDSASWKWDPNFIEACPWYAEEKPEPDWEDIINASIDEGDWTDWEDELREEIIRQGKEKGFEIEGDF